MSYFWSFVWIVDFVMYVFKAVADYVSWDVHYRVIRVAYEVIQLAPSLVTDLVSRFTTFIYYAALPYGVTAIWENPVSRFSVASAVFLNRALPIKEALVIWSVTFITWIVCWGFNIAQWIYHQFWGSK